MFPQREIIDYLLEIGVKPNGKINGGSEAIDRCLWNIHFKSFSYRNSGIRASTFSFYEIFDCIRLLARKGAIWNPDDSKQMNGVRKLFYECDPDVTIAWLKIIQETGCASPDTVRSFLSMPHMKEHLAGEKWWLSHLKVKDLVFPKPRPVDLAELSRGSGPIEGSSMRTRHSLGHGNVEIENEMKYGCVWASSCASPSPEFPACVDSWKPLGRRELGERPRI